MVEVVEVVGPTGQNEFFRLGSSLTITSPISLRDLASLPAVVTAVFRVISFMNPLDRRIMANGLDIIPG